MAKKRTPSKVQLGDAAKAFLAASSQVPYYLRTSVEVLRDEIWARLVLELGVFEPGVKHTEKVCNVEDTEGFKQHVDLRIATNSTEETWLNLITRWRGAVVDPATTTLDTNLYHKPKKVLLGLAAAAWGELLGAPHDTSRAAKQQLSEVRAFQAASVENMVQLLRSGSDGVEQFAKTGPPAWLERDVVNMGPMIWFPQWVTLDLAGAKLMNLVMKMTHASRANFAGADLTNSNLRFGDFPKGNFESAVFRGADLVELKLLGANLQNADFSAAQMQSASLRNAKCKNASFVHAKMYNVNLCSADLTGADLTSASLEKARYDKDTKWPEGFEPTAEMRWMGGGASPAARKQAKLRAPKKKLDIKAFIKRLEKVADPAKLEKALSMLKAEHFKLFAEVTEDRLVGVVKSQVKDDLVYSCKINCVGVFGCCTPDLKPCWGMRDTLCKHLLVLIIGLANNGEIDPNVIDRWVHLSQGLKPKIDKETMADTLVRYKGAEAGEIDWRPTETTPEDYYAM